MADPFLCPKFTVETGDEIFLWGCNGRGAAIDLELNSCVMLTSDGALSGED
ncbi:hypothetical protein LFREDSHE_28610 [Shewanella baltica]